MKSLILFSCLFSCFSFYLFQFSSAQETNKNNWYKDDKWHFKIPLPAKYHHKKNDDKTLLLRDKNDLESYIRISVTIENFETYTSKGGIYNFSEFVRKKSKFLYEKINRGTTDSLIIKDFISKHSVSGKEIYVSILDKDASTGKEFQTIKGPVYIFDISSKVNIPGTALIMFQPTDDSKTTRVLRSIADELNFEQ